MPVETRYFRSDTHVVNGLTAYILGIAQSAAALSVSQAAKSVGLSATLGPISDYALEFPFIYPSTPTTHFDKVDDVTADDLSTYVRTGDSTIEIYDDYGRTAYTLPSGQKVALVRVVCRLMTQSLTAIKQATARFGIRIGATRYMSGYKKTADAWVTYTQDWIKNPATGLAWTEADINGLYLSVSGKSYFVPPDYYYAYCTQVYMEVYTYVDDTVFYGVDVVKREADGTETVLGSKVAIWSGSISSLYDSPGLYAAAWGCPQTALESTDAIVVRVYQKVGVPGVWNLTREFITEQLGAQSLDSATWIVYYYVDATADVSYVYTIFYHGIATYNSRIENFTWTPAAVVWGGSSLPLIEMAKAILDS